MASIARVPLSDAAKKNGRSRQRDYAHHDRANGGAWGKAWPAAMITRMACVGSRLAENFFCVLFRAVLDFEDIFDVASLAIGNKRDAAAFSQMPALQRFESKIHCSSHGLNRWRIDYEKYHIDFACGGSDWRNLAWQRLRHAV